jgi:hypothetical protein
MRTHPRAVAAVAALAVAAACTGTAFAGTSRTVVCQETDYPLSSSGTSNGVSETLDSSSFGPITCGQPPGIGTIEKSEQVITSTSTYGGEGSIKASFVAGALSGTFDGVGVDTDGYEGSGPITGGTGRYSDAAGTLSLACPYSSPSTVWGTVAANLPTETCTLTLYLTNL